MIMNLKMDVHAHGMIYWDDLFSGEKIQYRRQAKAAIEAMRKPTHEQRNNYWNDKHKDGWSMKDSVFNDATWERMIDAALKEE